MPLSPSHSPSLDMVLTGRPGRVPNLGPTQSMHSACVSSRGGWAGRGGASGGRPFFMADECFTVWLSRLIQLTVDTWAVVNEASVCSRASLPVDTRRFSPVGACE